MTCSWAWWSAERWTGVCGWHQWPRCLTSEGWASRCRRHGKIHQPNSRGWRPTDNRSNGPRRVAGPVRAPGTVSGGGAEVLWAAHQRGAGMGGVLPVLQRAPGAPPANSRSQPGKGTVLHPPAPGRNRSTADTQQRYGRANGLLENQPSRLILELLWHKHYTWKVLSNNEVVLWKVSLFLQFGGIWVFFKAQINNQQLVW